MITIEIFNAAMELRVNGASWDEIEARCPVMGRSAWRKYLKIAEKTSIENSFHQATKKRTAGAGFVVDRGSTVTKNDDSSIQMWDLLIYSKGTMRFNDSRLNNF